MDDELKVVVSSVLEADVDESAQRIASQLPAISEMVNAKSNIKIGVELERNSTQNITQQINRELSKASRQAVGVSVKLDTSAIRKFQSELDKLGVNDKITRAISAEMDSMGVRIDKIGGAWKEATEGERQLLNLTIQGTDQLGRKVAIAKQFAYAQDQETAELKEQSSTITRMTADLEKQRQAQERLAAQQQKDNASRTAALEHYKSILADLQAAYTGKTGAKGITDQLHLQDLDAAYRSVTEEIKRLENENGALSQTQRASIDSQIANLKRLIKEYQNTDYVATKLRTKDVATVKADQIAKLDQFEQKLRDAGVLTNSFQSGIDHLRTRIASAFDAESITLFLNKFDSIQNHADTLMGKISQINNLWQQLGNVSGKVADIQQQLISLDPTQDAQKIAALQQELALYQEQELQIGAQIQSYGNLNALAQGRIGYEQQANVLAAELAVTEAEVADNASKIDVAMQGIPTAVEAIRARFAQLANPTQALTQSVAQLDTQMRAVSDAKTDQEKIAAYKNLAETIGYCRKELTGLSTVQRKDVLDVKFTSGLEKAKADLATIARIWSAFKNDNGLNTQFQQLSANLQRVSNQADLTKWTAQFNAFKSEVRAAGLNVQSLSDTLRNNLGKVLQWVSATTLLFRAFRLLKSAVSTIVELDTAMVDLRKVTTGSKSDYQEFYQSANDTAKALNSTTEAVISQTAEWARLGYSMQDAAKLAENAMVFAAVSPGMDQSAATDGLVSIIKAYGIEVEDTMDGIISKVNDIGNKFAVSNADIVEVLTRSSSAMAAANNTFEETVALATAAVEITRDANTVGNALKTLSMRIRGYDEETEEYSEEIAVLTGKIADFTKTASNPKGVTLFTDETNQTYRSTYEILSDIADIWNEISDVDQARLLENLFGKRQAQVGAAILSNFDQARKSIVTMEGSAGSAGREMEKIMDSLEYRINALKETWTGVAQNLFQQEDLKVAIEALTTLSNIVDLLTSKLGLFGSVTLAGIIGWLANVRSSMSAINTAIMPVMQTVASINFDGSAASTLQYAAALSGLDAAQQKVVMSAVGLSAAEQAQVMEMMKIIAVTKQYTVAELEKALGMEAGTLASSLNVSATAMVTEELLRAAIANGTLSAEQLKSIVSTNAQTGAMIAQAGAANTLGAAMKTATASMLTNPLGWITLAIGLIPLLIKGISKLIVTAEEANDKMTESFSSFEDATSKVNSLNDELDTTKARIEELEAKDSLTFVEESELQKLRESVELLTIQADLAEKERVRAAKESANDTVKAFRKNFAGDITQEKLNEYIATSTATGNNAILLDSTNNIAAMLAGVYQMKKLREECEAGSDDFLHFQSVIDATTDTIWEQTDLLSTYKSNLEAIPYDELTTEQQQALNEINAAIQLVYQNLDPAKWKAIQWDSIINNSQYADDISALKALAAESEITADTIREKFPELAKACEDAGLEIEDVVNNLNALSLDDVGSAEQIKNLKKGYEAIKSSVEAVAVAQRELNVILMDGDSLTEEAYQALVALAGSEEALAGSVDTANGYLITNAEYLNKLVASATEAAKAELKLAESEQMLKHHELVNTLKSVCNGLKEYDDDTMAVVDALLDQIDATQLQIAQYKLLEQQILGVTNAYDALASAKAIDDARDYTDDLADGISGLIKSFENHEFGTQYFKTAFESFIPEDIYAGFVDAGDQLDKGWDYLNTKLARYFNYDNGNVSIGFGNIQNFVNDALTKTIGNTNETVFTGTLENFDLNPQITSIKQLADEMGVTTTVAFSLANAISKYTIGNDDFLSKLSMDGASLETQMYACDVQMAQLLEKQKELGKAGQVGGPEWNALLDDIQACNIQMGELGKKAKQNIKAHIKVESDIVEQQQKVDALKAELDSLDEHDIQYSSTLSNYNEAKQQLDTLIQEKYNLEEPTELTIEVALEQVQGEIDATKARLAEIANYDGENYTVKATADADQSEVDTLVANLEQLESEQHEIKVYAGIDDEDAMNGLETIENFKINDKSFSVSAYTTAAMSALRSINSYVLQDKSFTVTKYEKTVSEVSGNANTYGTARTYGTAYERGRWGTRSAEKNALLGELGEEIVVDPNTGIWQTVGENGAVMMDLPKGAIIFNHRQTEQLLKNRRINSRGQAYAWGNAHAFNFSDKDFNFGTLSSGSSSSSSSSRPSSSSSSASSSAEDAESEFERLYKYHQHLLAMHQEAVKDYIVWLDEAYKAAYDRGEIELDDYYKYEEEVFEKIKDALDDLRTEYENAISLTQIHLDRAVADRRYADVREYASEIVSYYRKMQDELHKEAEYYRSIGYSDTSDEVSELSELWWEYYEAIQKVAIDAWQQIVDTTHDAVDEIQNVYDTLHKAANEFADFGGYITIDTYQEILKLGPQYMAYLMDENEQLVIQDELIEKVIAAKTEELALDNAMMYVERLRLALNGESAESLDELLYATQKASAATWDLVYANLAQLGLSEDQYKAAVHNIDAIRNLAKTAIAGIGQTGKTVTEELQEMKSGLDDILKYVMDMLKQRINDQIDALEDAKDAYSDLIKSKKESLELTKEEANYQKSLSKKMKEIAALQAKIDALGLAAEQGDRKAIAERASLMEKMAELQEDLADTQADHTLEAQKDALDQMEEAFHQEKDDEIEILRNSISSYQKLYEMAIDYISSFTLDEWDKMLAELTAWNYEYGNDLESDIVSAWESALSAARRYGDYVSALNSVSSALESSNSNSDTHYDTVSNSEAYDHTAVETKVSHMKQNSREWGAADPQKRLVLEAENRDYADQISEILYGTKGKLTLGHDGVWYLPDGRELYKVYAGVYHQGGVVASDGTSTLKQDEVFAKLQKGEIVLPLNAIDKISTQFENMRLLQEAFTDMPDYMSKSDLANILKLAGTETVNNVTNNSSQPIQIVFGDTNINGAAPDAIQQHFKLTEDMKKEIARWLGFRF